MTPALVNGFIAIEDKEPRFKPSGAKPQVHDVAKMFRDTILADKDALTDEEQKQAEALNKAMPPKAVVVTGKAKAATNKVVKVDKTTATRKAATKAATNVVPKGGSCPDESLVYRGTAYAKVRY